VFSLEQPSLIKVYTRSKNAQNAVSIKLVSASDHKTVIAW